MAVQDDFQVLDSRVNFPQAGQSRAMSMLSLQFARDMRRQSALLQEDEEEFRELLEEHASNKPHGAAARTVQSLDQLRAWAWGVAGNKCNALELLKTQAKDKAEDYKKMLNILEGDELKPEQEEQKQIYLNALTEAASQIDSTLTSFIQKAMCKADIDGFKARVFFFFSLVSSSKHNNKSKQTQTHGKLRSQAVGRASYS